MLLSLLMAYERIWRKLSHIEWNEIINLNDEKQWMSAINIMAVKIIKDILMESFGSRKNNKSTLILMK